MALLIYDVTVFRENLKPRIRPVGTQTQESHYSKRFRKYTLYMTEG